MITAAASAPFDEQPRATGDAARVDADRVLAVLAQRMPHLAALLRPGSPLHRGVLDSLDLVELLCVVSSEFGVRLSEDDLAQSATAGDLAARVAAKSPPAGQPDEDQRRPS